MNGPQVPGGSAAPIGKRRAVEIDPLPLADLRLAVQWQLIGILGDQNLGDGCFGRNTAFDQPGGSRSLNHDILAGPTGILRAAHDQHTEPGGDNVELFADVFANSTPLIGVPSSLPTQTPATKGSVKPTNHASLLF